MNYALPASKIKPWSDDLIAVADQPLASLRDVPVTQFSDDDTFLSLNKVNDVTRSFSNPKQQTLMLSMSPKAITIGEAAFSVARGGRFHVPFAMAGWGATVPDFRGGIEPYSALVWDIQISNLGHQEHGSELEAWLKRAYMEIKFDLYFELFVRQQLDFRIIAAVGEHGIDLSLAQSLLEGSEVLK